MRYVSNDILPYDHALLAKDELTFFVLTKILEGPVTRAFTDDATFLACYSAAPFPVWIWTADELTEAQLEEVYQITLQEFPLSEGYTWNVKYAFWDYIQKLHPGTTAIQLELLSYDCPVAIPPHVTAEGTCIRLTTGDLDLFTAYKKAFHEELQLDIQEEDSYRRSAREYIDAGTAFGWFLPDGTVGAVCDFRPSDKWASIGSVYTLPACRRRHLAENLIYQVTTEILRQGHIPQLYTDANYIASNACYQKVGYIQRGALCTLRSSVG